MQTFDLTSIGILGTLLTAVVGILKMKYGIDSFKTKLTVAGLAVGLGTVYVLFASAPWWGTVLGILLVSQTIYALFLK